MSERLDDANVSELASGGGTDKARRWGASVGRTKSVECLLASPTNRIEMSVEIIDA